MYVEGAEPGDTLEVKILSIDLPIDYGYNGCSGFVRDNCDRTQPQKIFTFDRAKMTSEFLPGIVIPLKPFFGSMGVAPAPELGRVSSNPPGRHAGNLDNRELVAGSTIFIPVFVPGALFEIGDGHAAQGDGEVDQTAIETSLRGKLQLTVRKDMKLTWPRAEAATDYITMAAVRISPSRPSGDQEMIDFLAHQGPHEAPGVSAHEHRRSCRRDAAGGRPEQGRAREDRQEHLHEVSTIVELLRARAARASRAPHGDGARIALCVEGGAMRGVVSAGMVSALEELGLVDSFDNVYGSSAGAINAAFFWPTRRPSAHHYAEDISNSSFISPGRMPPDDDRRSGVPDRRGGNPANPQPVGCWPRRAADSDGDVGGHGVTSAADLSGWPLAAAGPARRRPCRWPGEP